MKKEEKRDIFLIFHQKTSKKRARSKQKEHRGDQNTETGRHEVTKPAKRGNPRAKHVKQEQKVRKRKKKDEKRRKKRK